MQLHRSPHVWLLSLPLVVACNQGGEALAGPIDLGGSSSSSTTSDPTTTTSTPTSAAPTTSASTTTSTSTGPGDPATTTDDAGTSGSSGAAASSTSDAPSPSCGDGQLDPGEECDPGISQLSQTGACTLSCETAKCGDNLVWEGEEFCDNGPENNDDLYGGCTTKCQFGPLCNDGKVQGPEECDFAADNGTGESKTSGGVPCDNGCRFQARIAFLSSTAYKGGGIGGVEGAHIKCQNLAKQAQYDSSAKFMAWISDAQHSPFQDFIKTAGLPYVRPDGVRIADDWDDLALNGPIEGIIVTDTGDVIFDKWVWTGTAPSGKVLDPAAHCQSWTNSAPVEKSRVGNSGIDKEKFPQPWAQWVADRHWTSFVSWTCDEALPLYCVEQ